MSHLGISSPDELLFSFCHVNWTVDTRKSYSASLSTSRKISSIIWMEILNVTLQSYLCTVVWTPSAQVAWFCRTDVRGVLASCRQCCRCSVAWLNGPQLDAQMAQVALTPTHLPSHTEALRRLVFNHYSTQTTLNTQCTTDYRQLSFILYNLLWLQTCISQNWLMHN